MPALDEIDKDTEDIDFETHVSDDEEIEPVEPGDEVYSCNHCDVIWQVCQEPPIEPPKALQEEDDVESSLTEAGKEMKSLLKNVEKEEDFMRSSSEEEDEEDFNVNDLDMYSKPKLEAMDEDKGNLSCHCMSLISPLVKRPAVSSTDERLAKKVNYKLSTVT